MKRRTWIHWTIGTTVVAVGLGASAAQKSCGTQKDVPTNEDSEYWLAERMLSDRNMQGMPVVGKSFYTEEERQDAPGLNLISPWHPSPVPSRDDRRRFVEENPRSEAADEILLSIAKELLKEKRPAEALLVFDQIIRQYPKSALVDYGMAIDSITRVVRQVNVEERRAWNAHMLKYPEFTADVAVVWRAIVEERRGNRAKAIVTLKRYLRAHPKPRWAAEDEKAPPVLKPFGFPRSDKVAVFQLAWLYFDNGDYDEAVRILEEGVRLYSSFVYVAAFRELLALSYEKLGDTVKERVVLANTPNRMQYRGHVSYASRHTLTNATTFVRGEYWRWPQIRSPEQVASRLHMIDMKGRLRNRPPSTGPRTVPTLIRFPNATSMR